MRLQFGAMPVGYCALHLLVICILPWVSSAYAGQQEELENLRNRIAAMQREMDKTSETKSEAADALRESEREISNINRKLVELTEKLRAGDHKLGKLQMRQQELNSAMTGQHALLGNLQIGRASCRE